MKRKILINEIKYLYKLLKQIYHSKDILHLCVKLDFVIKNKYFKRMVKDVELLIITQI